MNWFTLFRKKKVEKKQCEMPTSNHAVPRKILTEVIVSTWSKLDADILVPFLADDFVYNSVWVSNTMEGAGNYLQYLRGKFETIKSGGDLPIVDLIEENGKMLPHLMQKSMGVESVIDFESSEGKITRMLMRPIVHIKVVDDGSWGEYAQAYREFLPAALQISGSHIQKHIEEKGFTFPDFSWIQTQLLHPYFQHLCFRYKQNIFSILIAIHGFQSDDGKDDDSIVVSKRDYNNLINECRKNNLTPCIIPVSAGAKLPMLGLSHIIHAETERIIHIEDEEEKESIPMSEWEISNMGINTVVQYISEQGHKVHDMCDIVGIEPQIWFENNNKRCYVIVRSIPIGYRKHKFEINQVLLMRLQDYDGYFADVQYASVVNNGDFEDKVLWRGDKFYCNFTGLQEIEKAIVENNFIQVVEKKTYDI